MDVSIAVSLIRGQMGAVVERAVNGAVETVLAEMLKVVGVKFEELKVELLAAKRGVAALQREKLLKEQENEHVRARLRYTELKLKYYRQGVEEELQHRAANAAAANASSAMVRVHPSTANATPQMKEEVQRRSSEGTPLRSPQECTSSQSLVVSAGESVDDGSVLLCPSEGDSSVLSRDLDQEDELCWTAALNPASEEPDPNVDSQVLILQEGLRTRPESPDQNHRATMFPGATQVKQEPQEEEQEEEEPQEEEQEEEVLMSIKEEPQEEVMASLLLDSQLQQLQFPGPQNLRSVPDWSRLNPSQSQPQAALSSASTSHYPPLGPLGLPGPSRPALRPWTKDLSLYEEFKLHRNELRRRNINRRRELEKNLPQPLLADLVRERREKTRLRVARWRAKRKLQAQAPGGAAALSGFTGTGRQVPAGCASQSRISSAPPTSDIFIPSSSSFIPSSSSSFIPSSSSSFIPSSSSSFIPSSSSSFIPSSSSSFIPSSSSSSVLLRGGPPPPPHLHVVTSSSSSFISSFPPTSQSQSSISVSDSDLLQSAADSLN